MDLPANATVRATEKDTDGTKLCSELILAAALSEWQLLCDTDKLLSK